jgi:hypothetical protein
MKKLLIPAALLITALPFTFDGVTPTVSKAHAIIGRPLTPFSVAGVHRRMVRRTFGVGANLGYRGFYHRRYGAFAYHRPFIRRPVLAAAAVGATGWGGGWGGSGWGGWGSPLYSAGCSGPFCGGGGGWGGGWGWNRPLYSAAGWGSGWGWNRPLFSAGVGWGGGGWGGGGWGGGWGWNRPWRGGWGW